MLHSASGLFGEFYCNELRAFEYQTGGLVVTSYDILLYVYIQ